MIFLLILNQFLVKLMIRRKSIVLNLKYFTFFSFFYIFIFFNKKRLPKSQIFMQYTSILSKEAENIL